MAQGREGTKQEHNDPKVASGKYQVRRQTGRCLEIPEKVKHEKLTIILEIQPGHAWRLAW